MGCWNKCDYSAKLSQSHEFIRPAKFCRLYGCMSYYHQGGDLKRSRVMSRKRARERPAVDTQLVEIYEDLASLDESIRLKAACSLLKNFISNKDISSEQISQIFDRLFRGICSGRKAARLGFSIALTEGLSEVFQGDKKHPSVFENAHQVVELIRTSTRVSGGAESQVCLDFASVNFSLLRLSSVGRSRSSARTAVWSRCHPQVKNFV